MTIKPITFRTACDFIALHHRHHKPTVGCKFSIGLYEENALIGEAGGTYWTGVRDKGQQLPSEMKTRWSRRLRK